MQLSQRARDKLSIPRGRDQYTLFASNHRTDIAQRTAYVPLSWSLVSMPNPCGRRGGTRPDLGARLHHPSRPFSAQRRSISSLVSVGALSHLSRATLAA